MPWQSCLYNEVVLRADAWDQSKRLHSEMNMLNNTRELLSKQQLPDNTHTDTSEQMVYLVTMSMDCAYNVDSVELSSHLSRNTTDFNLDFLSIVLIFILTSL